MNIVQAARQDHKTYFILSIILTCVYVENRHNLRNWEANIIDKSRLPQEAQDLYKEYMPRLFNSALYMNQTNK